MGEDYEELELLSGSERGINNARPRTRGLFAFRAGYTYSFTYDPGGI